MKYLFIFLFVFILQDQPLVAQDTYAIVAGTVTNDNAIITIGNIHINSEINGSVYNVFNNEIVSVENDFNNKLKVYPNPTSEILKITSEETLVGKQYIIRSMKGKVVKEAILEDNEINIQNLNNGMYIISIEDMFSMKFIKL